MNAILGYDHFIELLLAKVGSHENEQWRDIPDHPQYMISDEGRVLSKRTQALVKELTLRSHRHSHDPRQGVLLATDPGSYIFLIHELVAEAFIENPRNLKQIRHINGNIYDNRASNLRWA